MIFNIKPTYYYLLERDLYASLFEYSHRFLESDPDNPTVITKVEIDALTEDEKREAMKVMKPHMPNSEYL